MAGAGETQDWTAHPFASAGGTVSPLVVRVREAIASVSRTDLAKIQPGDDLIEDLDMDALDRIELVLELESEFGIEISDATAEGWTTAGDVAAYVRDSFMKRSIP